MQLQRAISFFALLAATDFVLSFSPPLPVTLKSISNAGQPSKTTVAVSISEDDDDFDEDEAWSAVSSKMTFVPDDLSEAVQYDYYEFGIDTSLTQYDHKRGSFTVSLDLNTTAGQLLETSYDFSGFRISVNTSVATLTLK